MQDGGSQILDNIIANIQFTSTGDIQQTITAPAKVLFITFRRQPSTCPQQSGSSIHTALAFPWGFQQITSGDTPKSEGWDNVVVQSWWTTAEFITEYLKCCCVIPPKSDSIILYWTFYKSGKQGERNILSLTVLPFLFQKGATQRPIPRHPWNGFGESLEPQHRHCGTWRFCQMPLWSRFAKICYEYLKMWLNIESKLFGHKCEPRHCSISVIHL